jgi:hypothetical protein
MPTQEAANILTSTPEPTQLFKDLAFLLYAKFLRRNPKHHQYQLAR